MQILIPTVHLNGDSKQTLENDNMAAYRAITAAMDAISAACPNGRNFYPQGDGKIQQAVNEHRKRIAALETIRSEYETILQGIQEQ